MNKPIRKAVRCYLIKDNKVVVTKYKAGSIKEGYYDIPGGKIEEGEIPKEAAIREMQEETGLQVLDLKYKGKLIIEYPKKVFELSVFISHECNGEPQEFEENISEWIKIDELLQKERKLATIVPLDKAFIKGLIDDGYSFFMNIQVDENENVLNIEYGIEEERKNDR